jgi:hypothetical protein
MDPNVFISSQLVSINLVREACRSWHDLVFYRAAIICYEKHMLRGRGMLRHNLTVRRFQNSEQERQQPTNRLDF